ncbi:zinc ribbon domain-containing protein [Candidatus Dependentiae bacterium]|nr:zinc ribbon domain-containing protein [Candidatus Dependentiae bacterium]
MICPKCNNEITDSSVKLCPKCGYYLYRNLLKEIIWIIGKYYDKNDYFGIRELLNKAMPIAEGTKYESAIRRQITDIEIRIKERNKIISDLKAEAKIHFDKKDYKEALKCYRKLLSIPLRKREQSQIENDLIRVKAQIYKFEMKNLFNDENIKLFNL